MYNPADVCIPNSFMIVIDDVGWWCGSDDRDRNGPSRSGMERRHVLEDYRAIITLGRALGMRIKCGFVIGEWDRTNRLARVRNATKYGTQWNQAARLDPDMDAVVSFIHDHASYMEISLHGLMHMFWTEQGRMKYAEFFQRDEVHSEVVMTPSDVIVEHLDAFFELYDQNGFTQRIRSFIPPCFIYRFDPSEKGLSAILRQYGIMYVSTVFSSMASMNVPKPRISDVENGIITVDRAYNPIPWDVCNAIPPDEVKPGYFGMHWPNILHPDPEQNMAVVDRWVEYFRQYDRIYGIAPAKDNEQGSCQALYHRYAKVDIDSDALLFDFSKVDEKKADGLIKEVIVHMRTCVKPHMDASSKLSLIASRPDFCVYRLKRDDQTSLQRIPLQK